MRAKEELYSSQDGTACAEVSSTDEAVNLNNGARGGTLQDKMDMWRIGRDQELNVRREN